jgi:hypothetical protein
MIFTDEGVRPLSGVRLRGMATTITVNPFVTRQTPESRFSHYEGSWEELEALVLEHFDKAQPGYRDGVVLVPVPPERFYASTVEVTEGMKLGARFEARQEGEAPVLSIVAHDVPKQLAKAVDIVLYRADVLAEDDDRSSEAEWEIISVNARVSETPEPMDPVTMARNYLHLAGGTKGEFTAEEFAEAIIYWATHCNRQ